MYIYMCISFGIIDIFSFFKFVSRSFHVELSTIQKKMINEQTIKIKSSLAVIIITCFSFLSLEIDVSMVHMTTQLIGRDVAISPPRSFKFLQLFPFFFYL
jgi:hypothetical protein